MTIYEPLREGFRDFNKMLIDSQQWDIAHQERAAQNDRADKMLDIQLANQEFQHDMARKANTRADILAQLERDKFGLSEKRFGLEEKRFGLSQEQFEFNKQQSIKSLNHQIEQAKKQWASEDRRIAIAEGNFEMQKKLNAAQMWETERMLQPRSLNITALTGSNPDILGDPDLQQEVSDMFKRVGVPGATLSEDGTIVDKDNNPIQMHALRQRELSGHLIALADKYDNEPKRQINKISQLDNQIAQADQSIRELNKDVRWKATVGNVKARKARMQQERAAVKAFFTPQQQMQYFRDRKHRMQSSVGYLTSIGDTTLAASMQRAADKAAQGELAMMEALMKGGKGNKLDFDRTPIYATQEIQWGGKTRKPGEEIGVIGWDSTNNAYDINGVKTTLLPDGVTTVKPTTGGGSGTAKTSAFKIGQQLVKETALPQQMLIPHKEGKASFRKAADKVYSDLVSEYAPEAPEQYNQLAHLALDKTIQMHEVYLQQFKAIDAALAGKKRKGKYTLQGLNDNGETVAVALTEPQLGELKKRLEKDSNSKLGYIANWAFKTRQSRD